MKAFDPVGERGKMETNDMKTLDLPPTPTPRKEWGTAYARIHNENARWKWKKRIMMMITNEWKSRWDPMKVGCKVRSGMSDKKGIIKVKR
jgi:hypothetical protein